MSLASPLQYQKYYFWLGKSFANLLFAILSLHDLWIIMLKNLWLETKKLLVFQNTLLVDGDSGAYVVQLSNLILFLLTCLNVLNNIDYIIPYFPLFPRTSRRTRARSELPNVSFGSLCVKFYTVLPVWVVGSYLA